VRLRGALPHILLARFARQRARHEEAPPASTCGVRRRLSRSSPTRCGVQWQASFISATKCGARRRTNRFPFEAQAARRLLGKACRGGRRRVSHVLAARSGFLARPRRGRVSSLRRMHRPSQPNPPVSNAPQAQPPRLQLQPCPIPYAATRPSAQPRSPTCEPWRPARSRRPVSPESPRLPGSCPDGAGPLSRTGRGDSCGDELAGSLVWRGTSGRPRATAEAGARGGGGQSQRVRAGQSVFGEMTRCGLKAADRADKGDLNS
jgi:hypothetical protein